MDRALRCYVEGRGNEWEAICLDLDISVQGTSMRETLDELVSAIQFHAEYILSLPPEEQARFWKRRAPLAMRLRFLWYALLSTLKADVRSKGKERAELLIACPA